MQEAAQQRSPASDAARMMTNTVVKMVVAPFCIASFLLGWVVSKRILWLLLGMAIAVLCMIGFDEEAIITIHHLFASVFFWVFIVASIMYAIFAIKYKHISDGTDGDPQDEQLYMVGFAMFTMLLLIISRIDVRPDAPAITHSWMTRGLIDFMDYWGFTDPVYFLDIAVVSAILSIGQFIEMSIAKHRHNKLLRLLASESA